MEKKEVLKLIEFKIYSSRLTSFGLVPKKNTENYLSILTDKQNKYVINLCKH